MSLKIPNTDWKRFLLMAVVTTVVLVVGVGAGTYLGFATSGVKIGTTPKEYLQNNSYLKLGDSFPDYEMTNIDTGVRTTVSSLYRSGPIVMVFVEPGCNACNLLSDAWKGSLLKEIDRNIQVAIVYDSEAVENEQTHDFLYDWPRASRLSSNRSSQLDIDGIFATPTIVGLDENGSVQFISTGFDVRVDANFINHYL